MKYWDKALSLISGCTPVSPACTNCWLKAIDKRFGKEWDGNIQTHPERLELPLKTKKPTTWAIWSDLFHGSVPEAFINKAFGIMLSGQEHTFLICTKRPERMADYIEKLYRHLVDTDERKLGVKHYKYGEEFKFDNIFLGTTVENQEMVIPRVIPLSRLPFKKFLSVEPMLFNIHIPIYLLDQFDYVIAGCESGHHARETKEEWIRDLRDQCLAAGVPLWVKQLKVNGKMVYNHSLSTINPEDLWK